MVPVQVVRSSGGGALVVAGVCIDQKGPFTFLVDTGAATSLVDTTLADRLNLSNRTSPQTIESFGCSREAFSALAANWSVAGLRLAPQTVLVAGIRSPGAPNLVGVLGADVMSRYGAVRIDYDAQTLTVPGAEGPPLRASVRAGAAATHVGSQLSTGTSHAVAMAVQVRSNPIPGQQTGDLSAVQPSVAVSVRSRLYQFALDTGASITVMGPPVVREAGLRSLNITNQTYAGLACPITVSFYQALSWRLGTLVLSPAPVASSEVPAGLDGLFGSGTLRLYSPIVVDFADGALLLGPVHATP